MRQAATALPANVRGVPVAAGDTIRFIVYMGNNAEHDLVSWMPSVVYTSLTTSDSNLAMGKTYSSSSNYNGDQTADKAFDGDYVSNWQSTAGTCAGQWLAVDFGASTTFNKVVLTEYGHRTTGYRIEYWNGASWLTACTGTTITNGDTVSFSTVTGSKARIYFLSCTEYMPIIYEFEIYGPNQVSSMNTRCPTVGKDRVRMYEDPRRGGVTIGFRLYEQSLVSIAIADGSGRVVERMGSTRYAAGDHAVNWNGKALRSGICFVEMIINRKIVRRKLVMRMHYIKLVTHNRS